MSKYYFQKYRLSSMAVGNSAVMPVACVCDLVCSWTKKACNYQLRRLCCVRRYLITDATKNVVQTLITSRLHCCNSLLAGLFQLGRLKLMQNTAARLMTRTRQREHIKPVPRELQWLPVTWALVINIWCWHMCMDKHRLSVLAVEESVSRSTNMRSKINKTVPYYTKIR